MLSDIYDLRSDFDIFTTDYDLRICHLYDPRFNFFRAEFLFAGGSSVDGEHPGISHFLEHLISPTNFLNDKTGDYGLAQVNAFTNYRYNYYPFMQLYDLSLIKEVFKIYFNHFFSSEESFLREDSFLQEKARIEQEIHKKWHYKKYQETMLLFEHCGTKANTINNLGRIEDLEKITLEDLRQHFHKNYNREKFSLFVMGGLPKHELLQLLESVKVREYLQQRSGEANEIILFPTADFHQPAFKEFSFKQDRNNWEITRHYFLPHNLEQHVTELEIIKKVLYKVLFQRLSNELGLIYDLEVSGHKSYLLDNNLAFEITAVSGDLGLIKKVQEEIDEICADFWRRGESYFEGVRKELRNALFFQIPVHFQTRLMEFARNSLYEGRFSFVPNHDILLDYQEMTWDKIKFLSEYFQSDKGICIIEGPEI